MHDPLDHQGTECYENGYILFMYIPTKLYTSNLRIQSGGARWKCAHQYHLDIWKIGTHRWSLHDPMHARTSLKSLHAERDHSRLVSANHSFVVGAKSMAAQAGATSLLDNAASHRAPIEAESCNSAGSASHVGYPKSICGDWCPEMLALLSLAPEHWSRGDGRLRGDGTESLATLPLAPHRALSRMAWILKGWAGWLRLMVGEVRALPVLSSLSMAESRLLGPSESIANSSGRERPLPRDC